MSSMTPKLISFSFTFLTCICFVLLAAKPANALSPNHASLTFAQQIVELTNQQRLQRGYKPLKINTNLQAAAEWLSQDMVNQGALNHTDSLGRSFVQRLEDFGYIGAIGENIIMADTAASSMNWWMGSTVHRNNILGAYHEIGVGAKKSGSYYYGTQDFGNGGVKYPFVINGEDFTTDDRNVTLYIGFSGYHDCWGSPSEMRFSNDGVTWSEWNTYPSNVNDLAGIPNIDPLMYAYMSARWELSEGSGVKTVHAQFKTSCNETIIEATDTIEYKMPIIEGGSTVYRFFNKKNGAHLYTISTAERDVVMKLTNEWVYEGEKFQVLLEAGDGAVPVYRFWNKANGAHLYTINENEKREIQENLPQFIYEGIKFYVYENEVAGAKPVYRFFNTLNGAHLYTDSAEEKAAVMKLNHFQYEGTKFFVL